MNSSIHDRTEFSVQRTGTPLSLSLPFLLYLPLLQNWPTCNSSKLPPTSAPRPPLPAPSPTSNNSSYLKNSPSWSKPWSAPTSSSTPVSTSLTSTPPRGRKSARSISSTLKLFAKYALYTIVLQTYNVLTADREYRSKFSQAYKVLYKEGQLSYLTEILDSAQ